MQPTPEIEAFIARVNALPAGPGVSLDSVLQPSLDEETELRKLFATDKKNPRIANPHVGLVDVFDAPDTIRTTRARVVDSPEDLSAKYVMPVAIEARRDEGQPSIVTDLEEFKKNWAIFTEGSLSQLLDWNNVVAAGGSVLACLTPLNETDKVSKRAIRKFYHSSAYPTSDVDLFLWGLTPEQADAKIKTIYEAVRDSVPWDVTCIRTKHTVSIHSQYPYRSVQIVLRLYQSPAEILAGFDIDAPCCAYDGNRVWANPRAVVAMMRQCNTVDMSRRSPSYEVRLAKYSQRSFEVYVPTLDRSKIDPTIYERSIARMEGLARLLALEKLSNENMRNTFLEGRRQLRGRIYQNALSYNRRRARVLKGDLKAEQDSGVIEMNDYDVASLHIPYGPGWDARRVDKLIYQTDLGMNSTFNPKNKGRRLHRHPAFFGTVEEILEDCCGHCPKPVDDDENALQKEEDEKYIRGRIQYIEENPGRQTMTGSFKPIDVGEWSDQVYIKPTQALFTAIAAHDRATVQKLLGEEDIDVNKRDHVGRTTLHVAIFSKASDIAGDLIDAGARITARLADGRTPLHLAAQFDQLTVIQKLFEKNAKNVEDAEKKNPSDKDEDAMDSQPTVERPSSEDDWSSHDDDDIDMVDADEADDEGDDDDDDDDDDENPKSKKASEEAAEAEKQDIEDEEDQPDIINVNETDWDFGFTALSYAVLFGSIPILDALFAAGADVKLESKPSGNRLSRMHPLTLTILRDDEDEACKIAEHLLKNGASSSTADENMRTIFHVAVYAGRMKLVETLLRCDPNSAKVIDFPMLQNQNVAFPIVTAINHKHYGVVALLLAYDAKIELDEKDVTRAVEVAKPEVVRRMTMYGDVKNYLQLAYQPVEVALKQHDDFIKLLISLGATVDFGPMQTLSRYSDASYRRTIKEWVDRAILSIEALIVEQEEEQLAEVDTPMSDPDSETKEGWKGFHQDYYHSLTSDRSQSLNYLEIAKKQELKIKKDQYQRTEDIRDFLLEVQSLLNEKGAKGWREVYPAIETQASAEFVRHRQQSRKTKTVSYNTPGSLEETYVYLSATRMYDRQNVPQHLSSAYDELYEACYEGDNDKIQRLCLPVEGQENGGQTPLNISVKMIDKSISRYDQNGYTPLFAAIAGRRWSTAKVILAIATAQYHPEDDKDKIKFSADVDIDDESDDESCDSDESEMTVDQQDIGFVDISTRPSAVQCQVHPKVMLSEVTSRWYKKNMPEDWSGRTSGQANHLGKAVADHDLDAFTHIANLYQTLAEPLKLGEAILNDIINQDQVDILHEYIRRTGEGVNVDAVKKETGPKEGEEEIPIATNDSNKIYLGLDVHGKKRMDLAAKNDPNASQDSNSNERDKTTPILWKAILKNSKGIVKYFASNRPLEAYKAYATSSASHGDVRAIWLRRNLFNEGTPTAEAKEKLSAWLGWKINFLGESPLIAALINGDLDLIKLLAKLEPALMTQALKTNIKFVGLNVLHFAVRRSMTIDVIEYILRSGVSPAERDSTKGWNIFHSMCDNNNAYLLEFFLKKLPKELIEELLKQQSKSRFNTPLHVAVKHGFIEATTLLLRHDPSLASTLLQMRDVDGQTPLHCAIRRSSPGVTKNILEISKTLPSPSSHPFSSVILCMEDSVGLTPVELARHTAFTDRINTHTTNDSIWYYAVQTLSTRPEPELDPRRVEVATPVDSSDPNQITEKPVEKGLRDLKELVTRWEGEGKEKIGKADVKLLRLWVDDMEKRVNDERARQQKLKAEEEAEKKEQEEKNPPKPIIEERRASDHRFAEPMNVQATSRVVEDAVASLSEKADKHRVLIHLLDVQRSVEATITKASSTATHDEDEDEHESNRDYRRRREQRRVQKHGAVGELEAEDEEEEEKNQRRTSMVFQYLSINPDRM